MNMRNYFFYTLILAFIISCSKEKNTTNDTSSSNIWNGPVKFFEKKDKTNQLEKNNQDSITENVIITRSNSGGQIFNIAKENEADKYKSPIGTEWAVGNLNQIDSLVFKDFRLAVKPQYVVGKKLVLHLIEEDIYLSVEFKSWSSGKYVDDSEVFRYLNYVFVPVELNTTKESDIKNLPGVGKKMAHEFIEYRPYKNITQFRREIGKYVDEKELNRLERLVYLKEN